MYFKRQAVSGTFLWDPFLFCTPRPPYVALYSMFVMISLPKGLRYRPRPGLLRQQTNKRSVVVQQVAVVTLYMKAISSAFILYAEKGETRL